MIDIEKEEAFPLREACTKIPGRPSYSTLWRWATKGVAGGRIRLETIRKPGEHLTTLSAIKRFLAAVTQHAEERLTNAEQARSEVTAASEAKAKRQAAAERELAEAGI